MKRLVAIAALTCAACLNPNAPTDAALATPFELAVGKTAELPDGVRITFDGVSADSRCPMDALCVTAGHAIVVVNVSRPGGAMVPIELSTTPNGAESMFFDHKIALTALAPYPRATQPIPASQYVATFVVTNR